MSSNTDFTEVQAALLLPHRPWPWDPFLKPNIRFVPSLNPSVRIAAVDLGSNSLRLTIFEKSVDAVKVIVDEKVICAIGDQMSSINRSLHPEGRALALVTLADFSEMIAGSNTNIIYAAATSAARETDDEDFLREACEALGFEITLVTPEQESLLTSHALLKGKYSANGLCFGLGGNSGHPAFVRNGIIDFDSAGETKFGHLTLFRESDGNPDRIPSIIGDHIRNPSHKYQLPNNQGSTFYAGGGALRDIGRELFERVYCFPVKANSVNHGHTFNMQKPAVRAALNGIIRPTRQDIAMTRRFEKAAKAAFGSDYRDWKKHKEAREAERPIVAAALMYLVDATNSYELEFFRHGIRHGILREAGHF